MSASIEVRVFVEPDTTRSEILRLLGRAYIEALKRVWSEVPR